MKCYVIPPKIVKEEDETGIVLVDNIEANVVGGLFAIAFGSVLLFFSSLIFAESNVGLLHLLMMLVFGLVGAYLLLWGLHKLLVKETIIIDKKLRSTVIMGKSFIKYLEFIRKIPFLDIKNIEVTYNAECKKCDYDSPSTSSWTCNSWDVSLITIDEESIQIYQSSYKPKAETIAEKICKITDAKVTHRTHYTHPDPFPGS